MRHPVCLALAAASLVVAATAATGPRGAEAASLEPIGSFQQPIFLTSDPADPDRLLVVERAGRVRLLEGGGVGLFADLSHLVSCCAGERGLLSIAPAPDFAASGRFYAAYTGTEAAGGAEGDIYVDAFRHDGTGALVREPILAIPHATFANHNGGQLQFGPDGHLYVSVGDGGGGGDPFDAGQDLETLLGKLLRIEPRPGEDPAYAIPPGNPFAGEPGREEIWAYGLRNPWRFSFDRAGGDLAIADVGQSAREEVNFAPSPAPGVVGSAGANYGWDCREGSIEYTGPPGGPSPVCAEIDNFTDPVFDYPHSDPGGGGAFGCSITGGYVVRDPSLGDLYGRYLYGDLCVGQLRSLGPAASDPRATDRAEPGLSVPAFTLHSFGEDSCGRVYVVRGDGPVSRLVGEEPLACPADAAEPPPPPSALPPAFAKPPPLVRPDPRPPRLLARVARRHPAPGGALRARILVRVVPCAAAHRGRPVRLNRGGRRFAAKRLDRRCRARFSVRARGRSTFRALYRPPGRAHLLRSPAVVVRTTATHRVLSG